MSSSQIEGLRDDIQKINKEILQLIADRVEAAKKIGKHKKAQNIPVHQPGQEEAVLQACRKQAKELDLNSKRVEKVFTEIIALSRKVQEEK